MVEKIPLLALAACSCVVAVWAQEKTSGIVDQLSFPYQLGNAVVSYAVYLGEMVCPAGLTIFYPHPGNDLPVWKILLAFLLLASISTAAFAWRHKRPFLLTGWLWYLGMLVPMIGVVQAGAQAHADRYTYLSQIGLYIAAAWMAADFCAERPSRRMISGAVASIIIAALMWQAHAQTAYWKSSQTLWDHAFAVTTDNAVVENNLGSALFQTGRVDEAIGHFQRSLDLKPDFARAHYNLGRAFFKKGRMEESISHFQKAVELKPDFAMGHNDLGDALQKKGETNEAIAQYNRALEIQPDLEEATCNLGTILLQERRPDEAMIYFQKALAFQPGNAEIHLNIGNALAQKGELNEAILHFQKAIKIAPGLAKSP